MLAKYKNKATTFFTGFFCLASSVSGQGTVNLPPELADDTAGVIPVKVGLAYSEGPVIDSVGNIYFSEDPDVMDGRIWKITPGGEESVFFEDAGKSNGLEYDPAGRLVSCQQDRLVRFGPDEEPDIFINNSNSGFDLGKTNDLSIGSDGSMYFTNLGDGEIFYRSAAGDVREFKLFNSANGIEWIEEQGFIYIAADGLQKCTVESNNDITGCSQLASHGVDGLTTDELGNIYTADWGAGTVKVHAPDGEQIGTIEVDAQNTSGNSTSGARGNTSNCIFGGPERKTLFITGDGGLYKVEMKVAGRVPAWWPEYNYITGTWIRTRKQSSVIVAKYFYDGRALLNWMATQPGLIRFYQTTTGRRIPPNTKNISRGNYILEWRNNIQSISLHK